ncbi:MAG TPA: ABC-2 family transporter protein [Symbiobacteriaceae bacterium]|nr:ABC-2 family transporter protein [Symbiobacteriaceae bacterium]
MGKFLRLYGEYMKANIAIAMEYRTSFVSQVFGMMINDALWVAFWVLYFEKFPILKGWTLEDVLVLWCSVAFSLGLVTAFLSNCARIPTLVVQGQLDYYLTLPKDVLLHLLISQFRPTALGDALFGPLLLVIMVKLTWMKVLVFLVVSLLAACVWAGCYLLTGSLAFFLGQSEGISAQVMNTIIHFATYPTTIFDNTVKFLLITILPAGFITTLPVELVREVQLVPFLELLAGAAVFLGSGVLLFRAGLRRYESGNLMMMRN